MSDEQWKQVVDSSMDRLKQLATSDDGWKLDKEKSGVVIHHRYSEDSPIVMMRGKTTIAASAEDVLKCTEDYETRKKWDELFNGGEVLKTIDDSHQVITLKFKSPSMVVSNRDFVMARAVKKEGNVILSNHVSVPYPDHGEQKGYVRGEIDVSGYVIEPLDNGKCSCTYVVQLDPKGWVPTVVVNTVASKQPMVLAKLRDHLQK